jgi:hypothetical protein
MNEWVGRWPDSLVSTDTTLDREFEERLRDSSGLAFNIAYGVLRHRADAEEVAQDAFARAFRRDLIVPSGTSSSDASSRVSCPSMTDSTTTMRSLSAGPLHRDAHRVCRDARARPRRSAADRMAVLGQQHLLAFVVWLHLILWSIAIIFAARFLRAALPEMPIGAVLLSLPLFCIVCSSERFSHR